MLQHDFRQTAAPGKPAKHLPSGAELITNEDIYLKGDNAAVLLIKAGQKVGEDLLAKLIRFGANPNQFRIQWTQLPETEETGLDADLQLSLDNRPVNSPASPPEHLTEIPLLTPAPPAMLRKPYLTRTEDQFLVFEPDDRSMKRLVDCMVTCGVPLLNIHPVILANNLEWAIKKYQPQYLFIDYDSLPGSTGVSFLPLLKAANGCLKQVVLTISLEGRDAELRKKEAEIAQKVGIKVIHKPLSRFALQSVFFADGESETS